MVTSERLTIDTPEQVVLELPLAGLGSRFLALAIDTVVQAILYSVLILILVLSTLLSLFPVSVGSSWALALAVFVVFCVYWGYFAAFEVAWHGQTPGKRMAGIRVIKDSGRPADVPALVLRNFLRAVDILPGMYGVGSVCMLITRDSRRVGDLVAGTVVVHDKPATMISAFESQRPPGSPATLAAVRISDEELALLETYLARRLDLPLDVQVRTVGQIVRLLRDRHQLVPAAGQNVDDFIEGIARRTRDSGQYRAQA